MEGVTTKKQVSAGGVVYRYTPEIQLALISVGIPARWQLPKGIIGPGEAPERAAQREVREETGLETELLEPIDTIEYWYFSKGSGARVRFHKFVHFYLFRYVSGNVADHDHEVNEACWFPAEEARQKLAFASEKKVVARALELLETAGSA